MAKLYYGSGSCTIEGTEIRGVQIHYRGAVKITKTCNDNFHIAAGNNKIIIFPIGQGFLNDLFDYIGEFKISSVVVVNDSMEEVDTTIEAITNYSERMSTNAEDLTTKSENLNAGYSYKNKVKKTTVDAQCITNLHTSTQDGELYTENGELYHGAFHVNIYSREGMTGSKYSETSEALYIKRISDNKMVKTGERPLPRPRVLPKLNPRFPNRRTISRSKRRPSRGKPPRGGMPGGGGY